MSHPEGAYLGGVINAKSLRDRCRIDGDCWRWSLAMCQGSPRVHLTIGGQKLIMRGRAAAWAIKHGDPLPAKMIAYPTDDCEHSDCVNPAHARIGTRAEWGAWLSSTGRMRGLPTKIAAARRTASARAKLTPEQVAEARASTEPQAVVAARMGVAPNTIWATRNHLLHKGRTECAGASAFTWQPPEQQPSRARVLPPQEPAK